MNNERMTINEEAGLPDNWVPLDVKPIVPSSPAFTEYPDGTGKYLQGSLPPGFQHDSSFVGTGYRGGPPEHSLMPLGIAGNPTTNAAIQSTANIVAQQVVATTPPSSGSGSAATDIDIISALNQQSFGAFDSATQQQTNNSTGGFSYNVTTQAINELAIVMGDSHNGFGGQFMVNPGVGWSPITAAAAYSKVLPTAGAQVVPVTYGIPSVRPAVTGLALFKTNGSTPIFTGRGSQSGGTTFVSPTFTPAVGSSLIYMVDAPAQSTKADVISVTDTAGNAWVKLFDSYATYFDTGAGLNYSAQVSLFYCQSPANVSTTITATLLPAAPGGSGALGSSSFQEVSNLSVLSSGSYTFQTSDNTELVQFRGGANITATLPSPALAGWQAIVSNSNGGTTTITPATGVLLNGSMFPVTLPPGGSTWVWSDGSNYFSSTTVLPSGIIKQTSKWLDSFNAVTGVFTQSQPAFTDITGNVSVAQLASGSGASLAKFWRGDGTWSGVGGVNPQTTNYTAVQNDAHSVISFNSATAVTLTMPAALFSSRYAFCVENTGVGVLTINRNANTIDGVASNLTLFQGQGVQLFTDGVSGWFTQRGKNTPTEIFQTLNIGLSANFNAGSAKTLFTPTVAAAYRISFFQAIQVAATTSSTTPSLTLGYTDAGGIARTLVLVTSDSTNVTTAVQQGETTIYTNGSTAVTITSTGYASVGATSMQYELAVSAEAL